MSFSSPGALFGYLLLDRHDHISLVLRAPVRGNFSRLNQCPFRPMIDRTRLWPCVFGALMAVGLVAAFVTMPFAAMVAVFIGFGLAGPMFYGAYRQDYKPGTRKALPQPTLRQLVRGGVLGGAAAVATGGYVAMTGPTGLLVPIVALTASPIGLLRPLPFPELERLGSPTAEPIVVAAVGTPARTAPAPPSERSWLLLDDADLCRAWRTSFTALQQCAPQDDRTPLVETRRQLLDELARRDPAGFDRWLDAGARAASNPHPFLTSTRRAARSRPKRQAGQPDDAGE